MDFSRFAFRPPGTTNSTSAISTQSQSNLKNISKQPEHARNKSRPTEVALISLKKEVISLGDDANQSGGDVKTSVSALLPPSSVSATDVGLKELFKSPTQLSEKPLRMIIVGHNPSYQSWSKGHYYANPVNRMWPILRKSEIVPGHYNCVHDQLCPDELGIGFTDILLGHCETQSSNIDDFSLSSAKGGLYERLIQHCQRVSKDCNIPLEQAYPRIVAFAGVRQFRALFEDDEKTNKKSRKRKSLDISISMRKFYSPVYSKSSKVSEKAVPRALETICLEDDTDIAEEQASILKEIDNGQWSIFGEEGKTCFGVQSARPSDWPKELNKSIIVLLPSTSGAAAMTTEAREGPYFLLGKLLKRLQYKLVPMLNCSVPTWNSSQQSSSGTAEIPSSVVLDLISSDDD